MNCQYFFSSVSGVDFVFFTGSTIKSLFLSECGVYIRVLVPWTPGSLLSCIQGILEVQLPATVSNYSSLLSNPGEQCKLEQSVFKALLIRLMYRKLEQSPGVFDFLAPSRFRVPIIDFEANFGSRLPAFNAKISSKPRQSPSDNSLPSRTYSGPVPVVPLYVVPSKHTSLLINQWIRNATQICCQIKN